MADIVAALDRLAASGGPDVPVHVDGASGATVAPFLDPDLVWDFRLDRVVSINTSGHKYGLVYPGVGWVLWRDAAALPRELTFDVNYLGGHMPTFALNFSPPGAESSRSTTPSSGWAGRASGPCSRAAVTWPRSSPGRIEQLPELRLISRGNELPVFAFTTTDRARGWDVFALSRGLRERGWQVPAYTFPPEREDLSVLRWWSATGSATTSPRSSWTTSSPRCTSSATTSGAAR